MKKGLIKFTKGIILLFTVKIMLFGGVSLLQSCEKDSFSKREQEQEKFRITLSTDMNKLDNIYTVNTNSNNYQFRNNDHNITIELYQSSNSFNNQDLEDSYKLNELVNLEGTELGIRYPDGSISDNISQIQTPMGSYAISEEAVRTSLLPTLVAAKNYLRSKGLSDADIQVLLSADETGDAISESNLIPLVMQLIAEEQRLNSTSSVNHSIAFFPSAYASQIGECAGDALGISAIAAAISEGLGTRAGKALLKKAIRKAAGRALGWVGAAIFVYEFGDCMGWW